MSRRRIAHVRWDRIGALVGIVVVVVVLALVAVHALSGDNRNAPAAAAGRRPTPPALVNQQTTGCRAPLPHPVRTAPKLGRAKTVALTFDDGPGSWTPKVLDVLHAQQVHATFFVIGRQAARSPKLVRATVAAGHMIGDHSWSHPTPSVRSGWRASTLTTEISRTQRILRSTSGHQPCLFRPPDGVVKGAFAVSRRAGVSIVLWSVDTRDWTGRRVGDAAGIRQRARLGLRQPHPLVLLHDGGGYRGATVAALPGIIADYRSHGYTFVTLDGRT